MAWLTIGADPAADPAAAYRAAREKRTQALPPGAPAPVIVPPAPPFPTWLAVGVGASGIALLLVAGAVAFGKTR